MVTYLNLRAMNTEHNLLSQEQSGSVFSTDNFLTYVIFVWYSGDT